MNKTFLNQMPAPTWNRLKINEAQYGIDDIDFSKAKTEFKSYSFNSQNACLEMPINTEDIITGVGEKLDKLVTEKANVRHELVFNESTGEPVVLDYQLDENNNFLIDENKILVEENVDATIIYSLHSEKGLESYHLGTIKIHLKKNAKLKLVIVQYLSNSAQNFLGVGIKSDEFSDIDIIRAEMGSNITVSGIRDDLIGMKSSMSLETIYYGDGSRYLDFNDVANHIGVKTNSNIIANGALFDSCKKLYRGTIDFKRGSKDAVGYEAENTLLFSDDAVNKSVPVILCQEESVQGEHAATIGRIDEALMFYINSRGFDEEQAKQLMIESSFLPVIDKIPDEGLRKQIYHCISKRSSNNECQFSE